MCNFCMSTLMFLTGHGIKPTTHAHVEITHFSNSVHHQDLEITGPAASYFPGPGDAPQSEMSDFCIGMGFFAIFCFRCPPARQLLWSISSPKQHVTGLQACVTAAQTWASVSILKSIFDLRIFLSISYSRQGTNMIFLLSLAGLVNSVEWFHSKKFHHA